MTFFKFKYWNLKQIEVKLPYYCKVSPYYSNFEPQIRNRTIAKTVLFKTVLCKVYLYLKVVFIYVGMYFLRKWKCIEIRLNVYLLYACVVFTKQIQKCDSSGTKCFRLLWKSLTPHIKLRVAFAVRSWYIMDKALYFKLGDAS